MAQAGVGPDSTGSLEPDRGVIGREDRGAFRGEGLVVIGWFPAGACSEFRRCFQKKQLSVFISGWGVGFYGVVQSSGWTQFDLREMGNRPVYRGAEPPLLRSPLIQ